MKYLFFFLLLGSISVGVFSQNQTDKIVVFFDDFRADSSNPKSPEYAKNVEKRLVKYLTNYANICPSLEIMTIEDVINRKEVTSDLDTIWTVFFDQERQQKYIPKNANIIIEGSVFSNSVEHEIKIQVLDRRNSENIASWIESSLYNFFEHPDSLRNRVSSIINNIFVNNINKKLTPECIPQTTSTINYCKIIRLSGSISGVSLISIGISQWGQLNNYQNCPIFANRGGCELYYETYVTHTSADDPVYPYTYRGKEYSREEVYQLANKKFKRDQIIYVGTGVLILLYTYQDKIPGLKKLKIKHPCRKNDYTLSVNPTSLFSYGLGNNSSLGLNLNFTW